MNTTIPMPRGQESAPVRDAGAIELFENLDAGFRDLAFHHGSCEIQFPSLIGREILERAEYAEAFPHLLMMPCACCNPASAPLFEQRNLQMQDWYLSPAVCYHAYAHFQGETVPEGHVLTARGRCYRREDHFAAGRRQIEFEMREIVLLGTAEWLDRMLERMQPGIDEIARHHGLPVRWEAAEDPFFLPAAKGKAMMQRLLGTKRELVCDTGGALALASINRHGTFFGERFDICHPDGAPVHTACVAFGLDRWMGLLTRKEI